VEARWARAAGRHGALRPRRPAATAFAATQEGPALTPGQASGGPSGRHAGEVMLVQLEQVVGGHGQAPFGADGGSPAAVEPADAAVVFGVGEDRLDDVLSLLVERFAVLGREHVAHEVIDAAAPARPRCCSEPGVGSDQDGDAGAGEPLDLLAVPVARIGEDHAREFGHARGPQARVGRR
jgi:hypothetical protein